MDGWMVTEGEEGGRRKGKRERREKKEEAKRQKRKKKAVKNRICGHPVACLGRGLDRLGSMARWRRMDG